MRITVGHIARLGTTFALLVLNFSCDFNTFHPVKKKEERRKKSSKKRVSGEITAFSAGESSGS